MSVEQSKNVYMVYEHPFSISHFKNVKKVCTKKNYTHIFGPSLDPNPRTSKMISFGGLMPKLTRPQSCVLICAIIVGVIQKKIFSQISKLCHKTAQVVMANLLACFCSTRYVL